MKKKIYENPTVTKVEFNANDIVFAKKCNPHDTSRLAEDSWPGCSE